MNAPRKNHRSDAEPAAHESRLAPALDERDREAARRVVTDAAVPHPGVYVPPIRPPVAFDDTQEMLTVRVVQDESRTAATQRNLRKPPPASDAEPLPALPVTRPSRKLWLLLAIAASVITLVTLISIAALVGRNQDDPALTMPSETARDTIPAPESPAQPPAPIPPRASPIEATPARPAPSASAAQSSSSAPAPASPAVPAPRAPETSATLTTKPPRAPAISPPPARTTPAPPPARTAPAPKRRGEEPWIPIE